MVPLLIALALLNVGFGLAWTRSRVSVRLLRTQLADARQASQSRDSLLVQRSQLDSVKDEFISTVSHELRTPLTSIRGALGLLTAGRLGTVDAKAQNLLRIALTNTDRLIRLINDILDLERMESGRAPLQVRRCSLRELVQQSMETMTPLADSADVRLEMILMALPEAMFFDGDPDRMLQVLTNLLSNAIKFSPPETRIEVRVEADSTSIVLRVSDEGRGIPLDQLDQVFDRFQQVEAADSRQKGGTGLGLAICRTIVQQHNGAIWAESNEHQGRGAGASLVFTLPRISRVEDMTAALPVSMLPPGSATVLVCDDDASIRMVVGESLSGHGYTILEAESGQHALELAEKNNVQAILLDLYMPGLTGWETLKKLKASPRTAEIPVVILSVLPPSASSQHGADLSESAQGWVQKPFNERLLLMELSRVLHTGEGPAYVLLVEDDSDLAQVIVAGFEEADLCVDHAPTRQRAIELCLIARPDLLIVDLGLPNGDAFSLVDWLRQQPDLRSLPLVVYSGQEVTDEDMSKLRLGPTQFLTKAKVEAQDVESLVLKIVQRLRSPAALRRS